MPGILQNVGGFVVFKFYLCILLLWHWCLNTRFVLAKQAFCHVSHAFNPFCSGYIGDRVSLFAQPSLDHDPSILCHCVQLLIEMESHELSSLQS
jgi:hypothetical protein